jgi:hypothetical protein
LKAAVSGKKKPMGVPPPPPDRPTERLRPTAPPPVYEERVIAEPAVDPNVILLRLEDAIEGLRTWLVIVGLIALAALCVAVYALATDDEGDGRGTRASQTGLATDERVTQLEDRIDRISRQVQGLRSEARSNDDTAGLDDRIAALEKSVQSDEGAGDATQAVEQLSGRVDELSKDIEELKSAQPAP